MRTNAHYKSILYKSVCTHKCAPRAPDIDAEDASCAMQIDALKYNFEQEFLSYLTQPEDAMQITSQTAIATSSLENYKYGTPTHLCMCNVL